MPSARVGLTSEIVGDQIYCIGGYYSFNYTDTVQIYDVSTDSWTTGTSMSTIRGFLASQVVDGKIYCIGGYNGSYANTVEVYDTGYRIKK